MLLYLLLFAYFAVGALLARQRVPNQQDSDVRRPMLGLGALAIAIFIGLRFEVGSDWDAYEYMFRYAGRVDLDRLLALKDPGYQILNWFGQQIDADIWFVNLVCGLIFTWGLLRFAKCQPDPWLTMVVAVPYLVVVVAMGYSRQGVAIGILLAGLASVERGGSVLRYALFVLAAALFHRTAVVGILLVAFTGERGRLFGILASVALFILLYDLFVDASAEYFVERYIDREYSSEGAAVRLAMTVVAAGLFLLGPSKFGFTARQKAIWFNFSLATIGFLFLLATLPSSTAVDRLALYVIPLQLAVLARVPGSYVRPGLGKVLVVGYSFAVLFAWMNFASHADAWIPYQFYPFD